MTPASVRIMGGRVDHFARQERPDRWRTLCAALPVAKADFERPLCGTPCTGCARALADAVDPAAALCSHDAAERYRLKAGQPPLPGSDRHLADTAHDRRVRARLAELAAERGVSPEELLTQFNAAFRAGQSVLPVDERPVVPPQPAQNAKVVAQRAADDIWGVVSLPYDGAPKAVARPCGGDEPCPWRRDASPGQFPAAAYELSAPTSQPGSPRRFGCHSSTPASPRMCAGWLLRGAEHNAEVQALLATGQLARPDLPDRMELYDSYAEMAATNGALLDTPADGDKAVPGPASPHQDSESAGLPPSRPGGRPCKPWPPA
ncbi:DUF6283 family protein [Streptomyces californicus]|uniref:DUF6283 family protein n=1 Tax=Streptomyces californicus TaxID=67351 RepID=UPI0036475981